MFYFYFSFFEHIFTRSRVRYSFKNPKISFFHKKNLSGRVGVEIALKLADEKAPVKAG